MRRQRDAAAQLLRTPASTIGAEGRARGRGVAASGGVAMPYADVVGRVGVEPTTSRLSGVRSNHLSYRPAHAAPSVAAKPRLVAPLSRAGRARLRANQLTLLRLANLPRMKGHEDGGTDMFFGMGGSSSPARRPERLTAAILRKEVIQPQVPLRLPCYDFTPVAKPTVVACLSYELAQRLRVNPTPMV